MLKNWSVFRSFNADVWRLIAAWGLISFAYFGVVGVLLNLYLLRLGFGVEFIGLFTAAGQFFWAMVSLPAGAVLRRLGLRPGILLGCLLNAAGTGLMLMVEWLPRPWWETWLIGGWLLAWLGAAFIVVASTPYTMLSAGPEGRNYAFSAQSAVTAFMAFMGSTVAGLLPGWIVIVIGGSLDDPAPYRIALWLSPLTYLLAAFVFRDATPHRVDGGTEQASTGRAPVKLFLLLGMIAFLPAVGSGATRAFFNVFLDVALGVQPTQIGAVMGVSQLLPVFMLLVTPYLLDRWGAVRTLVLVGVAMSGALVLLGASGHWVLAGLSFGAIFAIIAIHGPASSIFSQELVSPRWRTLTPAIISVGTALGWAFSAALGGSLIGMLGFRSFFFVCAVLVFASTPMLLGYLRVQRARLQPVLGD